MAFRVSARISPQLSKPSRLRPPPSLTHPFYQVSSASLISIHHRPQNHPPTFQLRHYATPSPSPSPSYTTPVSVDSLVEELQDLYATALDEFEIAAEETAKKSVYAESDRAAAKEALQVLVERFEQVVNGNGGGGEEVQRRVGGRIRELKAGMERVEEMALEE